MARELRIGDRVRSFNGVDGVVKALRDGLVTVDCPSAGMRVTERADRWTLIKPDIPRERVADLHAAVRKRLDQLEGERDTPSAWPMSMRFVHAELSEVAEALRLLLEVPDDAA